MPQSLCWQRTTTATTTTPVGIPGDVENNGELDINDVIALSRYESEDPNLGNNGLNFDVADVNGDGIVNANDITALILTIAHME